MVSNYKFLLFFLLSVQFMWLCGQAPLVKQWDYRFGCSNNEFLYAVKQTSDSGYILGGVSFSDSCGNKTQHQVGGNGQYWVVKTDKSGIKQWDKSFGDLGTDVFSCLDEVPGQGYIFGGSSNGSGGDRTAPNYQGFDFWIIRTDVNGNKLWDKSFGGNGDDVLSAVRYTPDGGFILGGYTLSDSSTMVPPPIMDTVGIIRADYWIIKLNAQGNMQWNKRIGGYREDSLLTLDLTPDGGYILGGTSHSDIGADKTTPSFNIDEADYWLVKVDSLGNKQWDNTFGGTLDDQLICVRRAPDGYILGGHSNSGVSAGKSEYPTGGLGDYDYWMVKTDLNGNKLWDRTFGGVKNEDDFGTVTIGRDGNYLVAGTSYSNASGSKSENNLSNEQTWVLKIDPNGNKIWDKTLFTIINPTVAGAGLPDDESGFIVEDNQDHCYLIANHTPSDTGGYKTQFDWGGYDYWMIKFCDTSFYAYAQSVEPGCKDTCTGVASVAVPNATNLYNYLWQPGNQTTDTIYNLCPGVYTVTVTDAYGDTAYSSVTIVNPLAGIAPIELHDTTVCSGQSVQFCAPGGLNYRWSNGATTSCITVSSSGSYAITASNMYGCSINSTHATVSNYANDISTSTNTDTFIVYHADSCVWYYGSSRLSGSPTQLIVSQPGNYTAIITDSNGCNYTHSFTYVVESVSSTLPDNMVAIYPNPLTAGNWHVDIDATLTGATCEILDAAGRVIYSTILTGVKNEIEFTASQQVYIMRITTPKGMVVRKLVKL